MSTAEERRWYAAVTSLEECVRCRRWGVQCAHRNQGKGMGLKTAAHMTAALCLDCHHEIDNGPNLTREERRAEMDRCIVLTHDALIRRGLLRLSA
jgi:hypothetical protein